MKPKKDFYDQQDFQIFGNLHTADIISGSDPEQYSAQRLCKSLCLYTVYPDSAGGNGRMAADCACFPGRAFVDDGSGKGSVWLQQA